MKERERERGKRGEKREERGEEGRVRKGEEREKRGRKAHDETVSIRSSFLFTGSVTFSFFGS